MFMWFTVYQTNHVISFPPLTYHPRPKCVHGENMDQMRRHMSGHVLVVEEMIRGSMTD